jgi:hypothetical protein
MAFEVSASGGTGLVEYGTVTKEGNWGFGTTDPDNQVVVAGTSATMAFRRHINSALGSLFALQHSRNATIDSHTILQNGDEIGRAEWQASDGVGYIRAAKIVGFVDGTPGVNDMPGRLVFFTTPDGSSVPSERMRIDNAGLIGINGVTSPSTELDIGAGAMEFEEMTAPGGGAANTARLYAVDNGAGKTQLAVVFNTGAVQILATEP